LQTLNVGQKEIEELKGEYDSKIIGLENRIKALE